MLGAELSECSQFIDCSPRSLERSAGHLCAGTIFRHHPPHHEGRHGGRQMFEAVAADQTPQYSDVRRAGHDGGDFLFVRRR